MDMFAVFNKGRWQSGDASDCKPDNGGSIPPLPSSDKQELLISLERYFKKEKTTVDSGVFFFEITSIIRLNTLTKEYTVPDLARYKAEYNLKNYKVEDGFD